MINAPVMMMQDSRGFNLHSRPGDRQMDPQDYYDEDDYGLEDEYGSDDDMGGVG